MTRSKAYTLADSVGDAGFSCSIMIGKDGACTVRVLSMRLINAELRHLLDIADRHSCELHLINEDGLTYFAKRETTA